VGLRSRGLRSTHRGWWAQCRGQASAAARPHGVSPGCPHTAAYSYGGTSIGKWPRRLSPSKYGPGPRDRMCADRLPKALSRRGPRRRLPSTTLREALRKALP